MILHEVSYHVPFFWVDDFYITGLLPLKAGNIVHRQFNSAYVLDGSKLEEYFTGPQWHIYVFSHLKDLNKILRVWNKLTKLAKREIMPQINKVLPGQLNWWWRVFKSCFFLSWPFLFLMNRKLLLLWWDYFHLELYNYYFAGPMPFVCVCVFLCKYKSRRKLY